MAKIIPFTGLRYNSDKIKDLSSVTTPPYDVISKADQKVFYEKHENNIIKLILGIENPDDTTSNNRYTRAKTFFNEWLNNDTLIYDKEPSIYLYSQEYKLENNETKIRHGFIALAKIEEFSAKVIYPHEQTLSGPKRDRLELIRHCEANFSQIFGLYADKNFNIESELADIFKSKPTSVVAEKNDIVNYLWKISDTTIINKLVNLMSDKSVVIADGHHRYETALNYRNERIKNNPNHTGNEPYNYVMFMFVNILDPGITILPTHRLLHNLPQLDVEILLKQLSEYFDITSPQNTDIMLSQMKDIDNKGGHSFGLYTKNKKTYLLSLKKEKIDNTILDSTKSKAWQKLDVAILHKLIIEKFIGLDDQHLKDGNHIVYSHESHECVERVDSNEFQLGFFLNATHPEETVEISGHGELMPQKSTYFYPKLLTGLVLNKL